MMIAVLGLGRLGAFHAKVLRELPGVSELRAYVAAEYRARTIAAEPWLAPAAAVDAGLAHADAAVILTPTRTPAPLPGGRGAPRRRAERVRPWAARRRGRASRGRAAKRGGLRRPL